MFMDIVSGEKDLIIYSLRAVFPIYTRTDNVRELEIAVVFGVMYLGDGVQNMDQF